jgi:hypothetical protein
VFTVHAGERLNKMWSAHLARDILMVTAPGDAHRTPFLSEHTRMYLLLPASEERRGV